MLSSSDYDAVYTPTYAQLLSITLAQIGQITATGTAYSINGRALTRANLPDLWKQVEKLESQIADADSDGGIALVQYGERY